MLLESKEISSTRRWFRSLHAVARERETVDFIDMKELLDILINCLEKKKKTI